ncbi:MAG TPA: ABC transporter ATP-binding protein [Parvibaculum sp.]|uniref:metal ABC transporter ATP-binding protein n=1 Tax=Parvibaculum sp. TaxID=2024848 RepID=UPI002C4FD7FE|nr:ABC transporter ATP-binding protein [Parvibaculum sp.]HMM14586.1 ABC transporter ATP-binding protein [Parvibaculum sp.]
MAGLIDIDDLTVAYDRRPAVHHLSGSFAQGSLTAVVGPNGAGKSTLLKSIVGLLRPSQGRIAMRGIAHRDLAYLPQQAEIDRSFPIDVADTVALGLWNGTGIWKAVTGEGRRRTAAALARVGLESFARHPIGNLSVGQFQRVLFARIILQDARVILLDEPFAAIDERTTADLLAIVKRWHEEGRTVIAVLHDMNEVREHFPETLLIARELVAWGPTGEALTDEMLARARAIARTWTNGHGREHAA